jgi:hypothetical protein
LGLTPLESLLLSNGVKEVFFIFESNCKYYQDAKCTKKNGFCDLKCDIDGFEDGIGPRSDLSDIVEVGEDDSDSTDQLLRPETGR